MSFSENELNYFFKYKCSGGENFYKRKKSKILKPVFFLLHSIFLDQNLVFILFFSWIRSCSLSCFSVKIVFVFFFFNPTFFLDESVFSYFYS